MNVLYREHVSHEHYKEPKAAEVVAWLPNEDRHAIAVIVLDDGTFTWAELHELKHK